jgi:hypothetical protein
MYGQYFQAGQDHISFYLQFSFLQQTQNKDNNSVYYRYKLYCWNASCAVIALHKDEKCFK